MGRGKQKEYRFTKEQIAEMRQRRDAGETYRAISERFNCSGSTISHTLRRNGWKGFRKRVTWTNALVSRRKGVSKLALYHHGEFVGNLLFDTTLEPQVLDCRWRVGTGGYALTNVDGIPTEFHRIFFPAPNGLVCDHENRDKLDNRRANVRHVTQSVNCRNTERSDIKAARPKPPPRHRPWGSGSVNERCGQFEAYLRQKYLGTFRTKEEAEAAIRSDTTSKTKTTYRKRGTGSITFAFKRWVAMLNGVYLGSFKTKAEAEAAIQSQIQRKGLKKSA